MQFENSGTETNQQDNSDDDDDDDDDSICNYSQNMPVFHSGHIYFR